MMVHTLKGLICHFEICSIKPLTLCLCSVLKQSNVLIIIFSKKEKKEDKKTIIDN
jgi:hypothetical protein